MRAAVCAREFVTPLFFPFPFLGTRIPIKFPIEFLMAFAATALMRGAHASALVCVFLSFCIQCVVARTFCVALWVHYGSLLLWTSFTQKCRQQWKVNSGWTCSGVERGERGVSRSGVGGLGVVFFFYVGLAAGNRRWCWKQCYDGRTWRRGYGQWVSGRLDQWHCGCG